MHASAHINSPNLVWTTSDAGSPSKGVAGFNITGYFEGCMVIGGRVGSPIGFKVGGIMIALPVDASIQKLHPFLVKMYCDKSDGKI